MFWMKNHLFWYWDCLSIWNKIKILTMHLLPKFFFFLIRSMTLLHMICFISLNISFYLGWNTFFISRLLLQISTVICWLWYIRSNMALIVILLLVPLKQWLLETIYIKLFIFITSKLHNTWGVLHLSKRFICWCDTKIW